MQHRKTLHILLVEDDEVDAEVIIRGFQRQGFEPVITLARNGQEALTLLRDPQTLRRIGLPHIILTDMNMPVMNGLELFQALRRDPNLRRSIVFVLSGSALGADRHAAYAQHIAGYLLKSALEKNFPQMICLLECYSSLIEFPPDLNVPSVAEA